VALPPAVTVRQVVDCSFSKTKLGIDDEARRLDWARRILAVTLREALRVGGKALLITHKAVEETIRESCHVPPWLELTHYGAVTGLDRWGDVRTLFIAGRPLPPALSVTQQAEALFGAAIPEVERNYVEREAAIPIAPEIDGYNAVLVKQWGHPDPMAELLRWQVCEAGVIQAIGRARGILRTEADPLDVWLLTDVPVPEIGAVVPVLWGEISPSLYDLMLAAGGVWLENAADAARAYPDIAGSAQAVRDARRGRSVESTYKVNLISRLHTPPLKSTPREAFYKRAAAGCKIARAIFLPGLVAELRRWLEERLGPLAEFREESP
jgi:hypothetical protein